MKTTLTRKMTSGGFNGRLRWKRGGMLWTITVEGGGEYAFNRKKDAVAAYEFATTEWDGIGNLPDLVHEWMIEANHELADSFKGEF